MKNKIKRISKGDFEVVQPDIQFSETRMVMRIGEGELYEGSFTLRNRSDGDIRGLVYPSSFRVHCREQGFEGNPVTIHYTFDGTGMAPGEVEDGKFSVVCSGGEYDIAFTAIVEKPYAMTDYGKIQSLSDFKTMAMEDFAEAQKLFRSRKFADILKYEDEQVAALYGNMRKWSLDEQAMEEFLVGTKQKERIYVAFQDEELHLEHYMETKKEMLIVTKSTWGYLPVKFRTEGDFLTVEKKSVTTDDFIGMNYYLEYLIDAKKLHAGSNYGKIIVETPYGERALPVTVHQQSSQTEHYGEEGLLFGRLLKSYMACISGRLDLHVWTEQAVEIVKELREIAPANEYYELLLAHVFLRGNRPEEGKWFLENYNYNRFTVGRKSEIAAYYLFLTGLLRKDELHLKRVVEELNRVYDKHPHSWKLLCMLLNIDPKFRNYGERLTVLREEFKYGVRNVMLYIEAYICYQEKSSLLKKLGEFELQILNFATKYKIVTKELILYTASLATQEKVYNERLYRILTRAYEMYEDPMILTAVCTQLIKGNKTGKAYFRWYQRAIEAELRIARLYEYYMMSADTERMSRELPRSVLLYFIHGNTLDYKKTAYLYANILTYEDETGSVFASYQEKMEAFAWEQLMQCHIDDNLRIIYKRYCCDEEVDMEQMKAIYDISHAYRVTTDTANIQYVLVMEKDGTISQRTPYTEDGAKVFLYHKTSRIIWETGDGRHFTDSVKYESKRLFYEAQFVDLYKKKELLLEQAKEAEIVELNLDNLKKYGIGRFKEDKVFRLCSKLIREREEQEQEEDYFSYLCFELLKRGQYDKVTLTYLADYYCSSTRDMKQVWNVAQEYEVKTYKLAERIVTQMIFSETMFHEEAVFLDYYKGGAYFRLKLAYLAYVAEEYVVRNRNIKESVIGIMVNELKSGEQLADVCRIAVLKYYADHTYTGCEEVLKSVLYELCEKQIVFPFYLKYKKSWLREVLLYDKVLVQYQTEKQGKVRISYRLDSGRRQPEPQQTEQLPPMYGNIYVKQFVLFEGERLEYTFKEYSGRKLVHEQSGTYAQDGERQLDGKFGRLNLIGAMEPDEAAEALRQYRTEEALAEEIFMIY